MRTVDHDESGSIYACGEWVGMVELHAEVDPATGDVDVIAVLPRRVNEDEMEVVHGHLFFTLAHAFGRDGINLVVKNGPDPWEAATDDPQCVH